MNLSGDINQYVYYGVAIFVWIFSAARLTRLLVADSYPPSIWARTKWSAITKDGAWSPLAMCHWCFGPWAALVVGAWGYLSSLHWTWWVFNGWLAGAYLTSMVVERDELAE